MTEQTFLDAILADPADDWVRLAYADWLMERGDPRGEFIAVQCEIARMIRKGWRQMAMDGELGAHEPSADFGERLGTLASRERDLFFDIDMTCLLGWFVTFPPLGYPLIKPTCVMRRGFIAEVHCTIADWMRHGPALVRACPIEVYRPVGVEPRDEHGRGPRWWGPPDLPLALFILCEAEYSAGIRDPWERISRAALKWACQRKAEEA